MTQRRLDCGRDSSTVTATQQDRFTLQVTAKLPQEHTARLMHACLLSLSLSASSASQAAIFVSFSGYPLWSGCKRKPTHNSLHEHRPQIANMYQRLHASTSNSTAQEHLNQHPKAASQNSSQNSTCTRTPQIAWCLAPRRQSRKNAPVTRPPTTTACPLAPCHESPVPRTSTSTSNTPPKQHPKKHPAITLAKSTPAPSPAAPKQHLHQHPNCTPPSTQPSISQLLSLIY